MDLFIVKDFLNSSEIEALYAECSLFYDPTADAAQLGSSVDIFEEFSIEENHPARTSPQEFFNLRWKAKRPSESHCANIKAVILRKLPSLVATLTSMSVSSVSEESYESDGSFLFNEHYVVKEKGSLVEFRWHTDRDEQFSALLPIRGSDNSCPCYFSVWCPLGPVNFRNGSLVVPASVSAGAQVFSFDGNDDRILRRQQLGDELQKVPPARKRKVDEGIRDDESLWARSPPADCASEVYLNLPAGAVVVFSCTLWHRSPPNRASEPRFVYYAQYSRGVIRAGTIGRSSQAFRENETDEAPTPLCFAVPCSLDVMRIE